MRWFHSNFPEISLDIVLKWQFFPERLLIILTKNPVLKATKNNFYSMEDLETAIELYKK